MDSISLWIKGLITVVVLSGFTEQLLPAGNMKKYVRFASGLIIIILVIKPVFGVKKLEIPDIRSIGQAEYSVYDMHDIYVKRLEENVRRNVGVTNVKIIVNPEKLGEIVYVRASGKKEEIAKYLGVAPDKVGD